MNLMIDQGNPGAHPHTIILRRHSLALMETRDGIEKSVYP